jgi:hypothetical protein
MKISIAAVLLSIASTSAFNVGYLNQLGAPAAPAKAAPPVKQVVSGGPASYLDRLNNGTPELVSAIESAPAVSAAPVAGAAPTSKDYLSALSSNTAISGTGLTGYLDALPSSPTSPSSGAGTSSYLDSMSSSSASAPAATSAPAMPATPYTPAPAAAVSAPTSGDYLSTLNTGPSVSGSGLRSHVDTLTTNPSSGTGAALSNYLSALAVNAAATSGAGLSGYLDALKTNSEASGVSGSPTVTSFLENVYKQIMSLPNDGSRSVSGNKMSYAVSSGPYAMAFVKN